MLARFDIQRSVRSLVLEGRLIRRRFRRHWKNYLLQCGLSTLALLMVLLVVDVVLQPESTDAERPWGWNKG